MATFKRCDRLNAADVVLVLTSFNVQALAWLTCDYLRFTTAAILHPSATTVAVSDDLATNLSDPVDDPQSVIVIENAARRLPEHALSKPRERGRR